MSAISLRESIDKAAQRLDSRQRARRADRGRPRIAPEAEAELQRLLETRDKPSISTVAKQLRAHCHRLGVTPPSRASVYNAVGRAQAPRYRTVELPRSLQQSLYNLEATSTDASNLVSTRSVCGGQVVFHAFNYGSTRAISHAAGLPWLCLLRGLERPGWRPKSRALLKAVMDYRGI